jgi:hypothetical protein|tara:strand:- start:252 stop:395 length:144 start_codon:yes stop_codon:yes gene_type:complete
MEEMVFTIQGIINLVVAVVVLLKLAQMLQQALLVKVVMVEMEHQIIF